MLDSIKPSQNTAPLRPTSEAAASYRPVSNKTGHYSMSSDRFSASHTGKQTEWVNLNAVDAPSLTEIEKGRTLREGMAGTSVRYLQEQLNQKGYSVSSTGYFGKQTTLQVRQFQADKALTVDGLVGPNTLKAIAAASVSSRAPGLEGVRRGQAVLKVGMSGNGVAALQGLLNAKGFSVSSTNHFDQQTLSALKQFQEASGLTVDGVVGKATLARLESNANIDALLTELKSSFVKNGRVPSKKLAALGARLDQILSDGANRQALVQRYGLDSEANKKALVAVTAVESGSNGDMGEVMTVVLNRALVKNMVREMTGLSGTRSVMSVVDDGQQFASRHAVKQIMSGSDTKVGHYKAFGPEARTVLDKVLKGQSSFKFRAANTFFFDQGGAKHDFKIGVHRFRATYMGKGIHYSQEYLQACKKIHWT